MPESEQTDGQLHEPNLQEADIQEQKLPAAVDPFEPLTEPEIQTASLTDPEPVQEADKPRGIAPIWHTIVLILAILAFSIWGAIRPDTPSINPLAPVQHSDHTTHATNSDGPEQVRVIRYALTGILELIVVAWVAFGLRLRKIPFRSLFGVWPSGLNDFTKEAAIAAAFWICSMIVLGSVAFTWNFVETRIDDHQAAVKLGNQQHSQSQPQARPQTQSQSQSSPQSNSKSKPGSAPANQPPIRKDQADSIRQLMELAPANGFEIAAWGLLCLIVGFSEELIFRGYLQSQGIALLHRVPLSLVLTALVFGAAHGYEGVRGIVIIAVYGMLFGGITLLRRNLFPGMLAHSWHDFATGIALSILRATHFLDHLPLSK